MNQEHILARAREFAQKHHKDINWETTSGYRRHQLNHLQEVVDLVWISGGSEIEQAAAWLHDTVEDTPVELAEIEENFGKEVADIVHGLTDLDEYKDLPTKERKQKQAERVKKESESVRRIKIADQISNTRFVSSDAHPNWTLEHNRDYVRGAKVIAENCKGVSPLLDEIFDREYKAGAKRLGI